MKVFALLALLGVALAKPHQHSVHQNNGNHYGHGHQGSTEVGSITTYAGTCGASTRTLDNIANYIVGGQEAKAGEYPWQVALVRDGSFICGGSYVRASDGTVKVITAAHCVASKSSTYEVIFGMHSLSASGQALYWATVKTVNSHRRYNSNTMSNDIAVLEFTSVNQAALDATHAIPICLASRAYTSGETATVSGWGTTSEGGSISTVLQYVDKPVLSYNYCNTQTDNAGRLDNTMMCAGDSGLDACQGDSGGPLAASRGGVWELIGVVSWGFGCGRPGAPGVYADVEYLKSWLANYKIV